jgi:Skp family chaperone for outer membrane proteins
MPWEVAEIQMNTCSTIFSSLALAICFVIPTQAQQPAGTAAPTSSPSTSAAPFKIAVIEMETFFNPEKGITRVVRAIEDLDQEFGPLKKEMHGLEQRYQALADEIAKGASTTDSRALQGKRFQAESLQRELRNKAEDAGQEFMKRLQHVLGPIEDDLRKAIGSYAGQRGITLVIDLDRARDLILYVAESTNVTQDFINEYNRRASAQAQPAKPPGN